MKKFIIFRTDRLGDFLIITNIIQAIKKKYKDSHITLVGSPYNKKIINSYKTIDKVITHDKNNSLHKKISIFINIIKSNYYCSLCLDGKSFSSFTNMFLKAKKKYGISYVFNFFDDFDLLKEYALANKKQKVLEKWVTDNINDTYINLSKDLSVCSCYNKWTK